MRYRHRPTEVDAIQAGDVLDAWPRGWNTLPKWLHDAGLILNPKGAKGGSVVVATNHGSVVATRTDWIIRGDKGEVYPARDDVFQNSYEPIEEK